MLHPNSGLEDHPSGTGNINSIVNSNWKVANNWINPAAIALAKQDNSGGGVAGTVVTITNAINVFQADDAVGSNAIIRFADGTIATITAFTDGQHVTVTPSQLVTAQAFEIYRTSETLNTALARGLMKVPRMLAAMDGLFPVWDNTNQRFNMSSRVKNLAYNALTAITFASAISFDYDGSGYQTVSLTGNLTLNTTNRGAVKSMTIQLLGDSVSRNLTFEATWKWATVVPTALAANAIGILSLTSFGGNASDNRAAYQVFA